MTSTQTINSKETECSNMARTAAMFWLFCAATMFTAVTSAEDVQLSANWTLEGDICPAGIEFNCTVVYGESIQWCLGSENLASYVPKQEEKYSFNLCENIGDNDIPPAFCINGSSLWIENVVKNESRYDIHSSLVTTGTYINEEQYLSIECGDGSFQKSLPVNFTMSCNPITLNLTNNNTNVDDGVCEGVVEFKCEGSNVDYFQWTYDNVTLSENFCFSGHDHYPYNLHSLLQGVNCNVAAADTTNCLADRFNFRSTCSYDLSNVEVSNVSSIGCVTSDDHRQALITCDMPSTMTTSTLSTLTTENSTSSGTTNSPWYKKLVFLDHLSFCHVNKTTSAGQNTECFGIVLAILVGILLLTLCSSFWCCCLCCRCFQAPRITENFPEVQQPSSIRMCPYANLGSRNIEDYVEAFPRKKVSLMSLLSSKFKQWRTRRNYERIRDVNEVRNMIKEIEEEGTLRLAKETFVMYNFVRELEDIGSRLQKFWFLRERNGRSAMQFIAKKSSKCPISFDNHFDPEFCVLQSLFEDIKHPHLLNIHDFHTEYGYVIILQDFIPNGSLRDKIFMADPVEDWSKKYTSDGTIQLFTIEEIATCGSQVLQAVLALYNIGYPPIGQIHCGNVFILEDKYILGGYENTLLGYRTTLYGEVSKAGLLNCIDVIMFGYMIYEMATGKQPDVLLSDAYDFKEVIDKSVKELLLFIFKKRLRKDKKAMLKIQKHKFFSTHAVQPESEHRIRIADDGKKLLKSVAEFQMGTSQKTFTRDDLFDFKEVIPKLHSQYSEVVVCPRVGSRIGKAWAKARSTELEIDGLLTAMIVPPSCPIYVEENLKMIKELLQLKHSHICSVSDIEYVKLKDHHVVVIFQDYVEGGSLKDHIHKVPDPNSAWEFKYCQRGKQMKPEQIARLGNQLLQAIMYLSHLDDLRDPLVLGCIHTGNIFLEEDNCKLGGFENTLLGCPAKRYKIFENSVFKLDVIMFGHVIFEMCSGKELCTELPKEKDYKDVPRAVRPVLKYIFDENTTEIHKILEQPFFTEHSRSNSSEIHEVVDAEVKLLLQHVREKKCLNQDDGKHSSSTGVKSRLLTGFNKLSPRRAFHLFTN